MHLALMHLAHAIKHIVKGIEFHKLKINLESVYKKTASFFI